MTPRQKILFGVWAMILAMVGDYLLGFGTFGMSSDPSVYMGTLISYVHKHCVRVAIFATFCSSVTRQMLGMAGSEAKVCE